MHQTVFLQRAVDYLQIRPDEWYVDATFGAGGHTKEILSRGGKVIAWDYDASTYEEGKKQFADKIAEGKLILVRVNFAKLTETLTENEERIGTVAGVLFDLGTNSDQLMSGEKGLSVYENGPLDMRLDASLAVTAYDLLQVLSEKQLAELFYNLGGEAEGGKIARAVVKERQKLGRAALRTSGELADLVARVKRGGGKLHPATKVFQALRMVVNGEVDNLEQALPQAWTVLRQGGRLVVIAFHEGEDRPVKQFMKEKERMGEGKLVTKKPVMPDENETNPRARSAKMRVMEKIK